MGKSLIVTKEMAVKTILFGACKVPAVGNRIAGFSQSELIWAEQMLPINGLKLKIPLWAMSGSGYGDGDGYGYGSSSGYGSGYGDGDGSGYGSGYGDGDGEKYDQLPKLLN